MYYTSPEVYNYVSKYYDDPIVEWRTCNISGSNFAVYQSDLDFYQKIGPVFDTQKFVLPTPTLCREERMRKRLAWRNNLSFHKDTCDRTQKPIISIYSGLKPYKVYHQDIRWSDVRSPFDYGRDFDFSKTFREQYNQLMLEVPRMGMINVNTSNSQYANYVKDAKNCYMTAVTYYGAEDLVYSFWVMDGHNGSDLMYCHHIHQSYQCTSSINITKSAYLHECNDCSYCQYSIGLHGCEHCFMCYDLHNQKFCFQNKQLTKDEYEKTIIEYKKNHTTDEIYKEFREIHQQKNLRATSNQNSENSIGTGMKDCINTRFCFIGEANQDSRFIIGEHTTDCMDMTGGTCELVYEAINTGLPGTNNIIGGSSIVECNHMYFCDNCYSNSNHCFGSIGLRNASYCIFNKQYTKYEREKMCSRIINHMKDTGEWGNFFPSIYTPFSYNETQGHDRYPTTQSEAEKLGYIRYNKGKTETVKSNFSPKPIEQYNPNTVGAEIAELNRKELLSAIITCPITYKNFRITNTEIELCCKLNIELPDKHPELRYKERYSLLSPTEIHMRQCSETGQVVASCYGPERKNKIIADQVFDKKIYG